MAVDADRQDLNLLFFLLGQKAFQLPELLRAVGSPLAPVKYQDHILPAPEIGERDSRSVQVLKSKVGRRITYLDSVKVRGLQVSSILWA